MQYFSENTSANPLRATTILCVRKGNDVVIAGDGQVSLGPIIVKKSAKKIRRLKGNNTLAGFAGGAADGLTLLARLEEKRERFIGDLLQACVELSRDWRTDKYLRRLEAMLIVADAHHMLVLTGNGDVLEPEYGVAAIGSGGNYALSAARALLANTSLNAEDIAKQSLAIAAEICVYTNNCVEIEKLTY